MDWSSDVCSSDLDSRPNFCYNTSRWFGSGEMAEWFKALVLKTSDAERHRGFESLSLRHFPKANATTWRSTQVAEGLKGWLSRYDDDLLLG